MFDAWQNLFDAINTTLLVDMGGARFVLPVVSVGYFGEGGIADRDGVLRNFRDICRDGNLRAAKWFCITFELTTEDARADDNFALHHACVGGHLGVAKWLHVTFGLTADDSRADRNFALRSACEYGYLEVAMWLHETFGLTAEDARASNNYALRWTRKNGHQEIVEWLVDTFEL